MITSAQNQQVKRISQLLKKTKARNDQGLFIVEGLKMFLELPRERMEKVLISQSFADSGRYPLVEQMHPEVVADSVFRVMCDTQTPQGILAVARQYSYQFSELLPGKTAAHILVLEGVRDPGNLGAMVRTGEGAGITGLLMSRDTVDIYNPKTIRSTMGSIYRVPFVYADNLKEAVLALKSRGVQIYAAHLQGAVCYTSCDYQKPTAFLIGNESKGLSGELTGLADYKIKIPMEGNVESLNAAISAALLLYEARRQRDARRE